jgi:UV DNA damage endonuclease
MNIRLGLCCIFLEEPIYFSTTTATYVSKLSRKDALGKISKLVLRNTESLFKALQYCYNNKIYSFRVTSNFLPLKTHPVLGYNLQELPDYERICLELNNCKDFVTTKHMRVGFHPDQFVIMNSTNPEVVKASIREIEYQVEVGNWIGADTVNIHGGGVYGNKTKALKDLEENLQLLSPQARKVITLENDDKSYTPADLLPICERLKIPLVYDVHHHRCNHDGLTVLQATNLAFSTWDREPLFHVSSPINGWDQPKKQSHHDYLNVKDFPGEWFDRKITVEVEAKAKEKAIKKLMAELPKSQLLEV